MKMLVILLLVACALCLWMRKENSSLRASFDKANTVAEGQKKTIGMLNSQMRTAANMANKNERAQAELRQKIAAANESAVRREQTITRLLHENEAFRRWYSADLPDAVRRLHTRSACASAGDCLQRLPESQPLSNAG